MMTCTCKNHLEQFTCSGTDCQVCVLGEKNYIENPEFRDEKYCLNCAMKKAGFTMEELSHLIVANTENDSQCDNKSC
jgi:hypothetical protein